MKKILPFATLLALVLLPQSGCRRQSAGLSQPPAHGMSFLLEANAAAGDTNILPQIKSAMETRFSALGVKIFWEPVSTTRARILAPITDETKIQDARDCIVRPGVVEFRLVHTDSDNLILQGSSAPDYEQVRSSHRRADGRVVPGYLVEKTPQLTGKYFTHASGLVDGRGKPEIEFTLNPEGKAIFARLTRENLGHQLAVIMDGQLQSAPVINTPIEGGIGVITGQFNDQQALIMANAINCSLPAPVTLVESKTF